jgi:uncharacterized protein HemX
MKKKSAAGYAALLCIVIALIIGLSRHHAYHKRQEQELKDFLDSLRRRDAHPG